MAEKKKEEPTLEMRVAELEEILGVRAKPMEFTEQEVAAYNKIADALGVDPCRVHACRVQPPPQACRVQPCIQPLCYIYNSCRTTACYACRTGPCVGHQCISQCISQCLAGYPGNYEVDWSGVFRTLGY